MISCISPEIYKLLIYITGLNAFLNKIRYTYMFEIIWMLFSDFLFRIIIYRVFTYKIDTLNFELSRSIDFTL